MIAPRHASRSPIRRSVNDCTPPSLSTSPLHDPISRAWRDLNIDSLSLVTNKYRLGIHSVTNLIDYYRLRLFLRWRTIKGLNCLMHCIVVKMVVFQLTFDFCPAIVSQCCAVYIYRRMPPSRPRPHTESYRTTSRGAGGYRNASKCWQAWRANKL